MSRKTITLTLLFCLGTLSIAAGAEETQISNDDATDIESPSSSGEEVHKDSDQTDHGLAKDAGERRTPPWTNDSANINLQQPRTPPDENIAEPYSAEDFTVKPEWERLFADHDHFSTTSGEELYRTMCQACHLADGQGAHGAGDYPSFVGDERLRSPYYAIDVILNGFRGMPGFSDKLSNQQIADVVNYLRTNFGNQLEDDTTADDVVRVRH